MYNFVKVSGHNHETSQTWGFHIQCLCPNYGMSENSASEGKIFSSEEHCNAGEKTSRFFLKEVNKVLINPRKNGYRRDEMLKKILSIEKFCTRQ